MSLQDRYGNTLQTESAAARDHYVAGVDLVLSANPGGRAAFEAAVAADPGFALGHAGLARAAMFEMDLDTARAAIARAQALAGTHARSAGHAGALARLLSGDTAGAEAAVRAHVIDHPRDALVAQVCTNAFGLIGFSGRPGREADLLAYTAWLLPHYGDDWWMLSMHALSLCETGQAGASLEMMERALALYPRNANAAHFKAHAQYEMGETEAGLGFLSGWLDDYDRRGMLHGHLSWHVALWALHAGDMARMWATVDAGVGPGTGHSLPINVLTDTAAILHRAALAGEPVDPARWRQLSDYAARYFPHTGQSFADIHAALSHAMAGDGDRLGSYLDGVKGFAADLVAPVARAWAAILRQDWAGAREALVPVMADTARLGGSRAQRDLLELTWVQLHLRLGERDAARRALATRRPVLATTPPLAGYA